MARAALSLQIPTAGINLPNAFQYSYRIDGLLQSQRVNAGTGGTYSWTYSAAGARAHAERSEHRRHDDGKSALSLGELVDLSDDVRPAHDHLRRLRARCEH